MKQEKLSVVCVPTSFQVHTMSYVCVHTYTPRGGKGISMHKHTVLHTHDMHIQARQLIVENGLVLSDLENHPEV